MGMGIRRAGNVSGRHRASRRGARDAEVGTLPGQRKGCIVVRELCEPCESCGCLPGSRS